MSPTNPVLLRAEPPFICPAKTNPWIVPLSSESPSMADKTIVLVEWILDFSWFGLRAEASLHTEVRTLTVRLGSH